MCGRFSLGVDTDRLIAEFGIAEVAVEHRPRYNIAPTRPVPAVVLAGARLRLGAIEWGMGPPGDRGRGGGRRLINARSESVHRTPAFRQSFHRRRCWILADGFFEWGDDADGRRTPFHFFRPDRAPFAFAGLWDRWRPPGAEPRLACAILTTDASDDVRPVHGRMPVILPPRTREAWLDPDTPAATLRDLLRPYEERLDGHAVSTRVNSPDHDDPACIAPRSPDPT